MTQQALYIRLSIAGSPKEPSHRGDGRSEKKALRRLRKWMKLRAR